MATNNSLNNSSTSTFSVTDIKSAPPASSVVTSGFGASLTAGTATQNTLGYDVLLNINVQVTAATTATITVGIGSTNTPTQNLVVPTFSTAALVSFPFVAKVPAGYYVLVTSSGTITISSILVQAMAG